MSNLLSKIGVSDISSRIDYISLETNNEVLLSELSKITKKNDFIYITDGKSIFLFTTDGKLKSTFNKQGGGPDEYIRITDFDISEDGAVWILCRNNKALYQYDNGSLINKIDLSDWVSNISLTTNNGMLLYIGNEMGDNNSWQLKEISLTNKVAQNYIPINENKSNYLHVKSANHFLKPRNGESGMLFYQTFNDTIYQIKDGKCLPYCCFNLDNKNIPESFLDKRYDNIMHFFEKLHQQSYAYGADYFYENEKSIYYAFLYNKKRYLANLSKHDKAKFRVFDTIITDDFLNNYPISLIEHQAFIQDDGDLIILLDPFLLMEYMKEKLSVPEINKLKKRINYMEDMNPILLCITLI